MGQVVFFKFFWVSFRKGSSGESYLSGTASKEFGTIRTMHDTLKFERLVSA